MALCGSDDMGRSFLPLVTYGFDGGVVSKGVDASMESVNASEQTAADWAAVYEEYAQRLTRLAVLAVGPGDAHDLVTDAVWRAVSSRGWAQARSPGAYLTACLVNLAHDRRRQADRRRRREFSATSRMRPAAHDTADVDRSLVVRAALDSLSAAQLAVVFLHYWEDLTLERVAEELGVRVGTVRSHLDRAKRRLRPLLPDFETEYKRR